MQIATFFQRNLERVLGNGFFDRFGKDRPETKARVCEYGHAVFSGNNLCSYGHHAARAS